MHKYHNTDIKLFITFLIIYGLFAQWGSWDENSRLDLVRAIVEERTFAINSYYNNTGDRIFVNGHYYSSKFPGLSFMGAPLYFVWYNLNGQQCEVNQTGYFVDYVDYANVSIYEPKNPGRCIQWFRIILVWISSFFGALAVLVMYKTLTYFKLKNPLELSAIFGLGTLIFPYSTVFLGVMAGTSLAFTGFYLILKKRNLLGGVLMGFSVIVSPLTVPVVIGTLLYLKKDLNVKQVALVILLLAVLSIVGRVSAAYFESVGFTNNHFMLLVAPLCFILLYWFRGLLRNRTLWGVVAGMTPLTIYNFYLFDSLKIFTQYAYYNKLFLHSSVPFLNTGLFTLPAVIGRMAINSMQFIFLPYRNFFLYSPILIIAVYGLIKGLKKWRSHANIEKFQGVDLAAGASLICTFIIISPVIHWHGMSSFGLRYFVPVIPLLVVSLAGWWGKMGTKTKFLAYALAAVSVFHMFLGMQPWVEYGEIYSHLKKGETIILENPLYNFYLPNFVKYGPRSKILEHTLNDKAQDIRWHTPNEYDFNPHLHRYYFWGLPLFLLSPLVLWWRKELMEWVRHKPGRFIVRSLHYIKARTLNRYRKDSGGNI